jgi:hypothetical protein
MMHIENISHDLRINPNNEIKTHYHTMPHHTGQYLYLKNMPFKNMYDELYDGRIHPLYIFPRLYDFNEYEYLL